MPAPRLIRIFLSSPGDVADEREIALQVIDQLPDKPAFREKIAIRVIAWDKPGADTPMLASMTPQEAINQGLPKPSECDIVIVLFWSRMGTPLPPDYIKPDGSRYLSGTEWEYVDAEQAAKATGKPLIVVYRRTEEPIFKPSDPEFMQKYEQWQHVEDFFARFTAPDGSIIGGYNPYEIPDDFRQALENDLKILIQQVLDQPETRATDSAPTEETISWPEGNSLFPGLRAFQPDDSPVFFGRGKETDALLKRVNDSRFVAVVSASGAGKSSLVGAGLIPRLLSVPGSQDWRWLRFTPGEYSDDPFIALAAQLAPMIPGSRPRDIAAALSDDPATLHDYRDQALAKAPEWAELLLFVDQFEELFTVVHPDTRAPFIDLLDVAATSERLRTVATLRADFTHRCIEHPTLARLLNTGTFMLAVPERAALHEMITRPAVVARLEFENDLAWRILDDTGMEPGALALLAYTLDELYQACCNDAHGLLSHDGYNALGGVQGAIGTRGENTFAVLDTDAQATLPHVFRDLVEVDERGTATRQRASLAQFEQNDAAWRLLEAFTEARLLTTSDDEEHAEAVIEVAHEALFGHWPRLADWIELVQTDLYLLRQVKLAVKEWVSNDRNKAFLWPDERLRPVYAMIDRLQPTLDQSVLDFIQPEANRLLAELENVNVPSMRRSSIGERLVLIGDPRPGVGLRPDGFPDIVWCEVPGGEVRIKGSVFIVEPFYIAKYPITYSQFQTFVDDPRGYQNDRWWIGLKERFRKQKILEQHNRFFNYPRDRVSWYQSIAFCRWLDSMLPSDAWPPETIPFRKWDLPAGVKYEIHLPTEWEWQQAATSGVPTNLYPWGKNWDASCANTRESGLGRATVVGMYLRGISVVGALDLAGNLSEWCLNEEVNPANTGLSGQALRSIRGGSWDSGRNFARTTARSGSPPYVQSETKGFRVCVSSPIKSAAIIHSRESGI